MVAVKPCLHVRPAPEDVARCTRLEEEIYGRVEEMVRILARAQGRAPSLPVVAFTRREQRATGDQAKDVASYEFTTADGQVGCWDEQHGSCCSGPCPC